MGESNYSREGFPKNARETVTQNVENNRINCDVRPIRNEGYRPNNAGVTPPRNSGERNVQMNGVRHPSMPPRNSDDRTVWFLVAVVGILVVLSLIFVVSYLKTDVTPPETKETTVDKQTNTQTPDQTTEMSTTKKPEQTMSTPDTTQKSEEPTIPMPTFKVDLSDYEKYMNPQGDQRDAYLLLVNPDNPLAATDEPSDLINVKSTRKDGRATQQLREYAAKALEALMLEAEACGMLRNNTPSGYPLSVMSAYRTYSYQEYLFNMYVGQEMANKGLTRAQAEAIVVTYSCRPGTSEHQSGLCIDMHTMPSASERFKNEEEAKWLAENCHKFGFILRFPEDKTDVTKITYEPWHFRYVGRYHATQMKELNMCLEEYIEYLK